MEKSHGFRKLFDAVHIYLHGSRDVPAESDGQANLTPEERQFVAAETILLKALAEEKERTFEEGSDAFQRSTVCADQGKSHGATRAEIELINFYGKSGHQERAEARCTEIMERYRAAEDQAGIAWFGSSYLVPLFRKMGWLDEAIALQKQVVEWEKPQGEEMPWSYPGLLNTLAELYEAQGDYIQAMGVYSDVLQIRERQYNPNACVHMDAFEAGLSMSYNPTEDDRMTAFTNYTRCFEKVNQQMKQFDRMAQEVEPPEEFP